MNREEINYLLDRFLSGSISPEEQEKLEKWYGDFDDLEDVTGGMREEEQQEIKHRMLGEIKSAAFDKHNALSGVGKKQNPWNRGILKWAASLLVLGIAGVLAMSQLRGRVSYETDLGEVLIVTLPDSTEVTLNGNSSLSYQPDWLGEFNRSVRLEGEAFFEVKHTIDSRRFTINEGMDMGVEVYGTAFNYSARQGRDEVALQSGSVKVMLPEEAMDNKKTHFIKPGEVASYDRDSKEVAIDSPANIEAYYAWKEGRLILDNSTLPEIIDRIKGTYGIRISMDTANWRKQKVSGTLPLSRHPESLIKNLEKLFDVEIQVTNID